MTFWDFANSHGDGVGFMFAVACIAIVCIAGFICDAIK
jgi:hypothetical protein